MTQMHTGPQPPKRGTDAFFDSIRGIGISRSTERWIGGVAGGLARRLGVDPLIVRGVLAVSILVGGLGLVLYGIAWLLLPEESDGRIHAQQLLRGDVDVAVLGAGAAIITGLSVPSWVPWFGQGWTDWWRGFAWLGVLGLIALVIVTAARGRRRPTPPPPWQQPRWQQPPPPAGPPAQPHPTYPMGETMSTTRESVADGDTDATTTEVLDIEAPQHDTEGAGPASTADAPSPEGASGEQDAGTTAPLPPVAPPPAGWNGGQGWNGGWNAGPGWNGPAGPDGPRQWAPPPPPAPRATRERGPGAAIMGVVTALTLLVLAGLLYSERMGWYHGPVALTTLTVGLALLGVAIVVTGLRGRRAGGVTALAVVGLLVAMPMTAAANWDGADLQWIGGAPVGQVSQTPTSAAAAEEGFRLGAGDATLDLTDVPLSTTGTVDVPVRIGAGTLTVILPPDVSATAHVEMGAGEVTWLDEATLSNAGGTTHEFRTSRAASGDHVQLALDVRTGLGTVIFKEGN